MKSSRGNARGLGSSGLRKTGGPCHPSNGQGDDRVGAMCYSSMVLAPDFPDHLYPGNVSLTVTISRMVAECTICDLEVNSEYTHWKSEDLLCLDFYFMDMSVCLFSVCAPCVYSFCDGQKKALDPLELAL